MRPTRMLVIRFLAVCAVLLGELAFDVPPLHRFSAPGAPRDSTPAHQDTSPATPVKVAQARARIKHVVFVLLENHSFDNIFGRFPGADGATTAQSGTQTIPLLHAPPFYWHDVNHEFSDANNAIDKGKMDGFSLEGGADMNGDRMAYQQYTQADIPNLWAYAQHFTLGDHMFASAVGSTFPNHLYSVAAQSGGVVTNFQPKVDLATGHAAQVEALVRWQHPERGFIPPDHFILLAEQTGLIRPLTQWVLDAALRTCHEWQRADLDVRISIDDFGTGYSSLSHLRRLPVDEIKIDKSFVVDMAAREDDALIVRSIVDLAHHRDLAVVAEGVETPQIRDLLAGLDCDMAQGYGLSRPLPAAALTRWLQESHPAAAT